MEQDIKQHKESLKEILDANTDLRKKLEGNTLNWSISYDRRSDMVRMGGLYPKGTFYYPVLDTGVLIRVDKNNKIHGFAIENAKYYIKKHPEIAVVLSFVVYPYRSFFLMPIFRVMYHTEKTLDSVKSILTISDFVHNKALFAN